MPRKQNNKNIQKISQMTLERLTKLWVDLFSHGMTLIYVEGFVSVENDMVPTKNDN